MKLASYYRCSSSSPKEPVRDTAVMDSEKGTLLGTKWDVPCVLIRCPLAILPWMFCKTSIVSPKEVERKAISSLFLNLKMKYDIKV